MAIQQPLPATHEHSEPPSHEQAQPQPHPASNVSPAQNEALKIHNQGTTIPPLFPETELTSHFRPSTRRRKQKYLCPPPGPNLGLAPRRRGRRMGALSRLQRRWSRAQYRR